MIINIQSGIDGLRSLLLVSITFSWMDGRFLPISGFVYLVMWLVGGEVLLSSSVVTNKRAALSNQNCLENGQTNFPTGQKNPHLHWTSEESLNIADIFYGILFFSLQISYIFSVYHILSHFIYFCVNFNKDKVLDNIITQQATTSHQLYASLME